MPRSEAWLRGCAARAWSGNPPHSRHPKLPQHILGRDSLLHGSKAQPRITRPATGCSETCCCGQPGKKASAVPDISLLRSELQRQWHHAKNQDLGDRQITTGSGLRVWWTCDKCPSGLLHEWLATVKDRQNMDSQCPYCTNNSLCQHNSLLTVAPAVAAYWDTAKNGLTPDLVMAGSHARRHWLCPKCGHSWQAMIHRKVGNQSGCPKCSNISKPWNRQPSLTQSQHPAMLEFDFDRNWRAGLDPGKITAGSNKMVHWICNHCPKGQPHLFMASAQSRIAFNSGCPYCTRRKACSCNSLQSLYPVLAAEYDTARNGFGPEQVLARSSKMAFWKDASGHTWEQTPAQRTKPEKDRSKRAAIRSKYKQQV
ncbi:TPA: hypothetical protein ACH3X2_001886 [Trebouxia sp. C0005]